MGWFNKDFVHSGKIDRKFSKMIYKAFTLRNESDYEPFVEYNLIEVKELFKNMNEFISAIEGIIKEEV